MVLAEEKKADAPLLQDEASQSNRKRNDDAKAKHGRGGEDIFNILTCGIIFYLVAFFFARYGTSADYLNSPTIKLSPLGSGDNINRLTLFFWFLPCLAACFGVRIFRSVRFLGSGNFLLDKTRVTRMPWRTPLLNICFAVVIWGILILPLPLYSWGVLLGHFKFSEQVYLVFCHSTNVSMFSLGGYALATIAGEIAYNILIAARGHVFCKFIWLQFGFSIVFLVAYWFWYYSRVGFGTATLMSALIVSPWVPWLDDGPWLPLFLSGVLAAD